MGFYGPETKNYKSCCGSQYNLSSKLATSPMVLASKIGLGLVKIPKLEVRLACAFFV